MLKEANYKKNPIKVNIKLIHADSKDTINLSDNKWQDSKTTYCQLILANVT